MAAPRVFVSHSHQDDAFTQRLVVDLKAAGADVWVDVAGVGADDFQERINRALASCDWFLLVLTPQAIASPWVRMEVHAGIRLKVQERMQAIIQVLAEPVDQVNIPPTWGTFNHFDATLDYPTARNRVLGVLGLAALPAQPQETPIAQKEAPPTTQAESPRQAPAALPQRPQTAPPVIVPPVIVPPAVSLRDASASRPSWVPASLDALGFEGHIIQGTEVIVPPLCLVPAGEFLMGSDKSDSNGSTDELPQHRVTVAAFQIGRFPVTVAEYACAVRAKAVREPPRRKWLDEVVDWRSQLEYLDLPVVNISWQDALAYARWLAEITGQSWRLPSEAEWEKAARGTDGRIYPWGNTFDQARCNTRGAMTNTPTPIGDYPSGSSPYGAQDMAGNVSEWTISIFKPYPYNAGDGRENPNARGDRVLRGSSWSNSSLSARTTFRLKGGRDDFGVSGGFRLALTTAGA